MLATRVTARRARPLGEQSISQVSNEGAVRKRMRSSRSAHELDGVRRREAELDQRPRYQQSRAVQAGHAVDGHFRARSEERDLRVQYESGIRHEQPFG
jgi:hypothetical protein